MIVVRGLPPDLILCEEASVSVQKPLFLVSSSLQDNYERKFLAATSLLSRFSVQKHLWQKIASMEIFEFLFVTDFFPGNLACCGVRMSSSCLLWDENLFRLGFCAEFCDDLAAD